MNNQEAFSAMINHLRKQGATCYDSGQCFYRGPKGSKVEGMKCAVGCLIPDELYDPEFDIGESFGATGIGNIWHLTPFLHSIDISLLIRMQSIHDTIPPSDYEIEFEIVAKEFGLDIPFAT